MVCYQLGLLGTDLHVETVEALWRRLTNFASSSSLAEPAMSSAKRRLLIVLPPMLTVPSWSSKAVVIMLSRYMLMRVGECIHSCRTPVVRNQSSMLLLKRTALVDGLVKEVFDDSDKVDADVVLLHGCPQTCMPNAVEGLL